MPKQRNFVIAFWTILSLGALAILARPHATAQQPGRTTEAQLASTPAAMAGNADAAPER